MLTPVTSQSTKQRGVYELITYPATLPHFAFKTPFLKLSGECGSFEYQLPVLLAWCLQLMLHSTGKSADWLYCVQGSALTFSQATMMQLVDLCQCYHYSQSPSYEILEMALNPPSVQKLPRLI